MDKYIRELFETDLNYITQLAGAHGGGIHLVETQSGEKLIAKLYKDACFSNHVNTEVQGLELLSQKCQDVENIKVPRVIKSTSCGFLMEYFPTRQGESEDFFKAGKALAQVHVKFDDFYGLKEGDNFIGPIAQINQVEKNWGEFFFDHRLMFQAGYTRRNDLQKRLEQNQQKIISLLNQSHPQSSLLHGDLWSGNMLFDKVGNAILIDPAVYFGDREAELAMTHLFGGFLPDFYTGYRSVLPQREGEEIRRPIYTLYHLLNHFNIFGEGYLPQVKQVMEQIERI